jgi:hypothetical protein
MRFLSAALVCITVLYGVDGFFLDGWYTAAVDRVISNIHLRW